MSMSSKEAPLGQLCALCGEEAFLRCSRCLAVFFCDVLCQKKAWKDHKPLCVPAATAATALVPVVVPTAGSKSPKSPPSASTAAAAAAASISKSSLPCDIPAIAAAARLKSAEALRTGTVSALVRALHDACASAPQPLSKGELRIVEGCFALNSLCETEAGRAAVLAAGGPAAVVHVLVLGVPALTHGAFLAAIGALNKLGLSRACSEAAVIAGAAPAVVAILRALVASEESISAGDTPLFRDACLALHGLSRAPLGRAAVLAARAVPVLAAALSKYASDEKFCADALYALNLICSPIGESDAGAAGIVGASAAVAASMAPLAISALRRHASNERLSLRAVEMLYALSNQRVAPINAALLSAGAVPVLISALRSPPPPLRWVEGALVCQKSCGALSTIARIRPAGRDAALAAGVVPAIIGALHRHGSDAGFCAEAFSALANAIADAPAGATEAIAAGALPLCASALRLHAADASVCRCAIFVPTNVAITLPDAGPDAVFARAAGIIPLIVAALRAHASDGGVVAIASEALFCLTASDGAQEAAIRTGAVPVVASLFRSAPVETRANLMGFLRNVTGKSSGRDAALAAGVAPLLAEALRAQGVANVSRTRLALFSLRNMALSARSEDKKAVLDVGAVDLAALALRSGAFAADALACVVALGLFYTVADAYPAGCAAGLRVGAPALLVAALRSHADHASLCSVACCAMAPFGATEAGHAALFDAGAIPLAVAALRGHVSNASVVKNVCAALAVLASDAAISGGRGRRGHDAVVAAGAIPLAIAALKAHTADAIVVNNACSALTSIGCAEHREALIAAGAVEALKAAAALHGGGAASFMLTILGSSGAPFGGVPFRALPFPMSAPP